MGRQCGEQGVSELRHKHIRIQEAALLHGDRGFSTISSFLPENHIIILPTEKKSQAAYTMLKHSAAEI